MRGLPFTDELYAYGKREQYLSDSAYTGDGYESTNVTFAANLSWDINDSLTFRSITSTRDQDWGVLFDVDATHYVFFDWWDHQIWEETSQEFQLLGGGDRLNWVVGIYYHDFEELTKDQIWETWEQPGNVNQGRVRTVPRYRHRESLIARDDVAIFAEVVYDISDQLSLTVGARYSEEDFYSEIYANGEGIREPHMGTTLFGRVPRRDAHGVPFIFNASFDALTPRIALQYQFNDNVMGYITRAEGFNGGGVNSNFDSELPNSGITPYDGELLTNYEIGVRSDLVDNRLRLNATYFWGTWDDIQVGEILTPGQPTTTNAGEAEISGLEVESVWRATDSFLVNFTLAILDAEYTDVGLATTIQVGDRFPYAPETGYSVGLQWDNDLSSGGSVMVRFDYGWIDDVVTFRDRRFHWPSLANHDYGLASGRITYTPAAGNWDVALFATNLTDEYYRMGGFPAVLAGIDQGVVGRPREFGVTLRMRL
ncbi:TonB-dependent receptor [Candidatus Rariloculus sp.]|uniref:TonB-dependent receptor n=1 Tax=Candidatus Rariloculus sp. TaxID=3101265 RepID=UPI003D0CF808